MARIPRCCGSGVGWWPTAPIQPLAWEPPYATGAAQEMAKGQKKKKINEIDKLLARLTMKKRERTQINKIRNENGEQWTSQKYKGS